MVENVVLVDKDDNSIGSMEKMEAHEKGLLHRAFSVFIFNEDGQMLIHQRASHKYHSPDLWTNACCSHPRPGETVEQAAHRRLVEEMGFDTELEIKFNFIYKKVFDNGLTEHELDYVLIGQYNGAPTPNPEEVKDWKYIKIDELEHQIATQPEIFTYWFKVANKQLNNAY